MRRTIWIAGLCAALVVLTAALAGPLMSRVEQPNYTVERTDGPIEIRDYPPTIVASVTVSGERRTAISDGFKILAGYIFGGNEGSKKVEMTAPVLQERVGDRSPARPTKEGTWLVRFVMPRGWSLDTLPKAKDSRVELSKVAATTYAVVRFSGLARDAILEAKTEELLAFVKRIERKPEGSPIFAFYNPPWTLPFFRRNEVMVEIKAR